MQPTQTGIAVALALAVVALFFLFPGLSPLGGGTTTQTATDTTIPSPTESTTMTMPAENPTELQASDVTVGTGATAEAGDSVTVNYVGALMNGTVFDASANHGSSGFTFTLGAGQVIKGWDLGVAGMKEGGKRMLVIPSDLAYGNQAVGGVIPANSALVFEVELVKVQKAAQ